MPDFDIQQFGSGVHNLLDREDIPKDAASDSTNWITADGRIELARGKVLVGAEGSAGNCQAVHFGYTVNGTAVAWRKAGTKIQYLSGSTWTDTITGLSATDEYRFTNYQSLAGTFTYVGGPGGLYKLHNANPGSYITLYDSTKNFKGYPLIDKGRMLMWGLTKDPTGLYGSKIDPQSSAVYTTVTGEATTSLTGTLAFKAGGATRCCFGVQITITAGGEVYTDNYDGTLTGSAGGTGTINYITGDYTLSAAGVGTANYQWENSNAGGVSDFTKSATRLAAEGFVLRQDEGGDAILSVVVGMDGNYYSIKKRSAYRYVPDSTDLAPTNEVVRKDIGVLSHKAVVSTGAGIFFVDTSNPDRPQLTVLERNPLGDNILSTPILSHFSWENYEYADAVLETWGQFLVLCCNTPDSTVNNRLLLIDPVRKTVDITTYGMKCLAKDAGTLYGGSVYTASVYKVLDGWDDDQSTVENSWEGKDEDYGMSGRLKKYRRLRLRGLIDQNQRIEVYANYDNSGDTLIGTIRGDQDYVDRSNTVAVGSHGVGAVAVGGGDVSEAYPFLVEMKVKVPKFRVRRLKFVAKAFGYCAVEQTTDFDVLTFEQRIPKKYRLRQNVSLDGATTGNANPSF